MIRCPRCGRVEALHAQSCRARRVMVEIDGNDAELVGLMLQGLARDHKSPDPTVPARLQRVGEALHRAAKTDATIAVLEQSEVLS